MTNKSASNDVRNMANPDIDNVIEARNLSRNFDSEAGSLVLFDGISLTVKSGESIAIIGPSGSGKSTLLSLLAGLDLPDRGDVALFGKPLNQLSEQKRAELRRENVSFVFQSFHLLPELTALENVLLPLEIRGEMNAEKQAMKWLASVGLTERLHHYPTTLSGGEQQRVAIARAFVSAPRLLFADEPTGNLDAKTGEDIIRQLFELNQQQHTTLLLITHDDKLASRCDRCFRLQQGALVEVAL